MDMILTDSIFYKLLQSTPAHDIIAATLSHIHHLIIHVGAGPIQIANGSLSPFATDMILTESYFTVYYNPRQPMTQSQPRCLTCII